MIIIHATHYHVKSEYSVLANYEDYSQSSISPEPIPSNNCLLNRFLLENIKYKLDKGGIVVDLKNKIQATGSQCLLAKECSISPQMLLNRCNPIWKAEHKETR